MNKITLERDSDKRISECVVQLSRKFAWKSRIHYSFIRKIVEIQWSLDIIAEYKL